MMEFARNSFSCTLVALFALAMSSCSQKQNGEADAPTSTPSNSNAPAVIAELGAQDETAPTSGSLKLTDYLKQDCPTLKRISHKITGPFLTLEEYTTFFNERPMELRHTAEQLRERVVIRSDINTKVRRGLTYRTETLTGSRSEGIIRTGAYSTTKIKHYKSAYASKNMESLWNEKCRSFLSLRTRQDRVDLHEDDYEITYYLGQNVDEAIDPADERIDMSEVRKALVEDGKWDDHPAAKTVISRSCWISGVAVYDVICADSYLSTPGARPHRASFRLLD